MEPNMELNMNLLLAPYSPSASFIFTLTESESEAEAEYGAEYGAKFGDHAESEYESGAGTILSQIYFVNMNLVLAPY